MLQGFKAFITRGNVLDLAVGIIIGAAFTGVVTGLMDGLINPLIAAMFGSADLSGVGNFEINEGKFRLGVFLDAVVHFLLIAAVLYFVIVTPMNRLMSLRKKGAEPEPKAPAEDVLVLQEIRDLLRAQVQEQQRR